MLTPQDIKDKKFEKALVGGYEMSLVDDFLERLTEDYSALYRDNATLKSKLKVLVEKVEEYRSTEDSMRMALLTAQKMATEITDEAKNKADVILAEAQGAAAIRAKELSLALVQEEAKLESAKQKTSAFSKEVLTLIDTEREFLKNLESLVMDAADTTEIPAVKMSQVIPPAVVEEEKAYVLSEESFDTQVLTPVQPALEEEDAGVDLDLLKDSVNAFLAEDFETDFANPLTKEAPLAVEEDKVEAQPQNQVKNFSMFDQDHMDEQFAKKQSSFIEQFQGSAPEQATSERDLEKAEITRSISQALGDDSEIQIDSKIFDDEGSPTTTRPKFDFGDLQFGANYDVEDK